MAERKGKKLAVLADGHPRRLADGRNAWRKMNDEQRTEFLGWVASCTDGRELPPCSTVTSHDWYARVSDAGDNFVSCNRCGAQEGGA